MYTLLKSVGVQAALIQEAPYLVLAFIVASLFYKWGSFGIEAIGFLVTWFVFSVIGNKALEMIRGQS